MIRLILVLAAAATISASALNWDAAMDYSDCHGGNAIIVSAPGALKSRFRPGWSDRTPVNTASITKSITALAWLSSFPPSETITFRARQRPASAFLSQSSGLEPGRRLLYGRKADLEKNLQRLRWSTDSSFAYGPSHWEVIGSELLRHGRPVETFLTRIGIRPAAWSRDATDRPHHSAGAHLSASDLLCLGRLVADGGRRGWRRIIPADRLQAALSPSPANGAYGLGFWLNAAASSRSSEFDIEEALRAGSRPESWKNHCLSRLAPRDLVAMAGSGGQRVYIVPSRGLVVVRLGEGGAFRDPDFLRALFRETSRPLVRR
ncbi:MAG: hypothetical protein SFU53_12275 [Terrimicrobiaceae bacterium]|nr:hypothetical protein [Terrimicrobiaceae bacterium]